MKTLLMAAALAFAALAQGQSAFERVKQMILDDGFSVKLLRGVTADQPLHCDAIFKDATCTITILANPLPSQAEKLATLNRWLHGNAAPEVTESTLFGLGLGEHCLSTSGAKGFTEDALADRYIVHVTTSMKSDGTPEEIDARRASIKLLCDCVTRRMLAEAMANDLNDDGTVRGTAHLTGAEVNKLGMVPLATWAQNRVISVEYDDGSETASFMYHGRAVALHLASGDAIVSQHVISLGGKFIIARGNRWFVPDVELANAIG